MHFFIIESLHKSIHVLLVTKCTNIINSKFHQMIILQCFVLIPIISHFLPFLILFSNINNILNAYLFGYKCKH